MRPNREVSELSKKFGIRVKRMRIIQNGVYRITTFKGKEYCLKRMPYPPAQLYWIDLTLRRIRRTGSIRIGWRSPSRSSSKRLFVKRNMIDSPPFVLIPWIYGKWPSPASRKQMRASGRLLATFHRSGQKIKVPISGRKTKMGTWISYLKGQQRDLQKVIRQARRNGFRSPLDRMLQTHGNEILELARQSITLLKKSGYRKICRKSKPILCHGDYGLTNIIMAKNGAHLIDFETLSLDLRAMDLYRGIYNFCHQHHWKFSTAKSFLDGYQQISKLQRVDYTLLKALLRFPRDLCKLVENYNQLSPKDKRQVERDFPKILTYERRRHAFLKKLDAYAKGRH